MTSVFTHNDIIEVVAWGKTVGVVAAHPDNPDVYVFEYTPDWVAGGVELAPIHMPNRLGPQPAPQLNPETFYRLPPLLADSLPDRFGNAVIDAWMADRGIDPNDVTPLDRLAYTGNRAMGALEYRPPTGPETDQTVPIVLADLVEAARRALRGELADDASSKAALQQLIIVGTSAGGARPKAVIAYNPETSQIRSGQFDAPAGFEHWLVKFDGVDADTSREDIFGSSQGFGRIEYAYHLMAKTAGITMADCRLLPEGPRTHFLTRRFDRTADGDKLHSITLCGLAHLDYNLAGAHSYAQWYTTINELGLDDTTIAEAFRRTVFNLAAVNRDDHTKNVSFLCDNAGTWSLAPAYDITFSYNPAPGKWTRKHQMTFNGKQDNITTDDLYEVADRFAVPGYRRIIDDVTAAVESWPDFAAEAGVADAVTSEIRRLHRELGIRP